jgi:hypothetical protein
MMHDPDITYCGSFYLFIFARIDDTYSVSIDQLVRSAHYYCLLAELVAMPTCTGRQAMHTTGTSSIFES